MRTRYDIIEESSQVNLDGENYPDILTFPIDRFQIVDSLKKVVITQKYKERFYLICYDYYGVSYYDDIVLWLNGISSWDVLEVGELLYLPSKKDLERFFIDNEV